MSPAIEDEDVDGRLAELCVEVHDEDVDKLVGILSREDEELNMSSARENEKICNSSESFLAFTKGFISHHDSFLPIIHTSVSVSSGFNVSNDFNSNLAAGVTCVEDSTSRHPQVSHDNLPADCSGNSSPRPVTYIGDDVGAAAKEDFVLPVCGVYKDPVAEVSCSSSVSDIGSISSLVASHPVPVPRNIMQTIDGSEADSTDAGIGPVTQGFVDFNFKLQEGSLVVHQSLPIDHGKVDDDMVSRGVGFTDFKLTCFKL